MSFILILFLAPAFARESLRPTDPSQLLIGTQEDVGYRVRTAKVVAFNREALEEQVAELRGRPDHEVERWIEDECGYVNQRQLALIGIRNTRIDYDETDQKIFYIQPGVGRGADVVVGRDPRRRAMFNLKATGNTFWNQHQVDNMVEWAKDEKLLEDVRNIHHASGLEVYYIAVAEYLRHFIIEKDFDAWTRAGAAAREVVDPLFLMDFGFDVTATDRNQRAFVIGRSAHVGRATAAVPSPEIYDDHGFYQTTYSGAHIDFGGARTRYEDQQNLENQAKALGPERMKEFVRDELARLNRTPSNRPPRAPRGGVGILSKPIAAREIALDPRALGRMPHPEFVGDAPAMARLKWRLFQLSPLELERKLARLGDEEISGLYFSARGAFKMPLPAPAYLHGFKRSPAVREFAAGAARFVLGRFPELQKPYLKIARARLRGADQGPSFLDELIVSLDDFEGFPEFLLKAMDSPNPRYKELALTQVKQILRAMKIQLVIDEATCEALLDPPA